MGSRAPLPAVLIGFVFIMFVAIGLASVSYATGLLRYRGRGRAPGMKAWGLITSSSRRRARSTSGVDDAAGGREHLRGALPASSSRASSSSA